MSSYVFKISILGFKTEWGLPSVGIPAVTILILSLGKWMLLQSKGAGGGQGHANTNDTSKLFKKILSPLRIPAHPETVTYLKAWSHFPKYFKNL